MALRLAQTLDRKGAIVVVVVDDKIPCQCHKACKAARVSMGSRVMRHGPVTVVGGPISHGGIQFRTGGELYP